MKRVWFLLLAVSLALPLLAMSQQPLTPELQKLDISAGHWVYQGTSRNLRTGKRGTWSWDEHCAWSDNHEFLECSFSNVWSGRPIQSLVVDTYNPTDHSFWHYEIFTNNSEHPFVSKMSVTGNVWTESTAHERIVYVWSGSSVDVKIEASRDGSHWTVVDHGVGRKQLQ